MPRIKKLKYLYALKDVHRNTRTQTRRESVSDHVYSMQILANYLLSISNRQLDYAKLMKLILYHDVAEIELEDTFVLNYKYSQEEKDKEIEHNKALQATLPPELYQEYLQITQEYLDQSSIEARYASGIDALDPMVQSLEIDGNWDGFSEEVFRKHKEKRVAEFEEQKALFEEIIAYAKELGHID